MLVNFEAHKSDYTNSLLVRNMWTGKIHIMKNTKGNRNSLKEFKYNYFRTMAQVWLSKNSLNKILDRFPDAKITDSNLKDLRNDNIIKNIVTSY